MQTPANWCSLVGLDYAPVDSARAVLRLRGVLDVPMPSDPTLIVRRRPLATRHRVLGCAIEEPSESGLLWLVTFAVPLEIVECRRARFALSAGGLPALDLPSPRLDPEWAPAGLPARRFTVSRARRCLVVLGAGLAVAIGSGAFAGAAFAAAKDTHAWSPPKHTASIGTAIRVTRHKRTLACKDVRVATAKPASKKHKPRNPADVPPGCLPATQTAAGKNHHKHHGKKHHGTGHAKHQQIPHATHPSGGVAPVAPQTPAPHVVKPQKTAPPRPATSPAAPTVPGPQTVWTTGFTLDPFTAKQLEQFSSLVANLDQPPKFLIPIYKAAGRRYRIQWQILAAINAIETNYGQDLAVSPKGAIGWMQFMPGTWLEYGVAIGQRHRPNPYDPRDAIFSAARYLAANGAPRHIRRALFAYNHALWYVDAVLWRAQLISDRALGKRAAENGYALPLDAVYMRHLGRTDDGVDIEDAPDGAAVYSITPGIVTAVADDPTGFGPNYPVILVTKGPLAGQYLYYGHVAASLVHVGQRVIAGEPIAVMGHTGDAASLDHGHIEIGFSDGSGDPLNHHGLNPWTPSGDAMRHVLLALSKTFHVWSRWPSPRPAPPTVKPSPPFVFPVHLSGAAADLLQRDSV